MNQPNYMTQLDYTVLGLYFLLSTLLGLWFFHGIGRKTTNISHFFLSGRSMPWWLLGTSMVATTFAADAPILAARMAAEFGLYFSWMIIPLVLTATLTTFFFARLWRRSEVMTDVEFLELRYPSLVGRFLRGFKALYLGLLINALIIGTQLIAIGSIGEHVLGLDRNLSMLIGAAIALLYSVLGGFTGVVITDFLQFIIAMVGSLVLAYFVVVHPAVGGLGGLASQLAEGVVRQGPDGSEVTVPVLKMLPWTDTPYMTIYVMLIPLLVSWWSVVSGGMEPGGGGQVAQRMLAARSERHAAGASLWFNVAHFAVRVWPWLLVGLGAVLIYPDTSNWQSVYASTIRDVLPSGMRGLLVASFFAAFISTMDTRLNLGSAYLVNDLYQRFLVRGKGERHYLTASRVVTLLLCVLPFVIPYFFQDDILGVLMFWLQITAGTGLVYILRWYWWRINAWSEISAMIAAVIYTLILLGWKYNWDLAAYDADPAIALVNILIITGLTTVTWIVITLVTPPEQSAGLQTFYRKTRPAGPGWTRVRNEVGVQSPDDLRIAFVAWISGSLFLFTVFFGTGKLLLLSFGWATLLLGISAVSLIVLLSVIRRVFD